MILFYKVQKHILIISLHAIMVKEQRMNVINYSVNFLRKIIEGVFKPFTIVTLTETLHISQTESIHILDIMRSLFECVRV